MKSKTMAKSVVRGLVWFLTAISILVFLPPTASVSSILAVLVPLSLLVAGAWSGLFPLPKFLSAMTLQRRLTCLLFLGIGSIYVPNLGKYLHWGTSSALDLLPKPEAVPEEKVAVIREWFRPMDGSAKYYFSSLKDGFLVYTGPGICPLTGETLKEVKGEALEEIKAWAFSRSATLKQEELRNAVAAREEAQKQELAEKRRRTQAATYLPETNSVQQAIWPVVLDPNTSSEARTLVWNSLGENPVVSGDKLNSVVTDTWFKPLWEGDRSPVDSLDLAVRLDGLLLVRISIQETEGQSVTGLKVARGTLQIKSCPVAPGGEMRTWILEATQPAATAGAASAGLAKQFQAKFIAEVQPHLKP